VPRTDDRQGLPTTGTPEAVALLDAAVDSLLHFRVDLLDAVGRIVAADPTMPMGQVFAAYLGVLGTEADAAAAAARAFSAWLATTDLSGLTDRERAHVAVAHTWLGGNMLAAGDLLAQLTTAYPRDVLALAAGHQADFFTGRSTSLRDRIGGALTAWSADDPAYSLLLGMFAFGLEEAGHYDRSEVVGLEAVGLDRSDVWAIHAVAHTYEMQGRFGDGLRFMNERVEDFDDGNFFRVHNWWHYCLYALEADRPDVALTVYDRVLHTADTGRLALELLDATALLWRRYLDGDAQTERFGVLADAWGGTVAIPHYAFNDAHAVMAYVGAGRFGDAQALVADRARYLDAPSASPEEDSNLSFTAEVGLPVCRALVAFGQGRYGDVVDRLLPIRHRVHVFGGSHAQRDVVQRTLLEAAQRDGRTDVARQLLSERLGLRPTSPYNWRQQATLLRSGGEPGRAAEAEAWARGLVVAAEPSFTTAFEPSFATETRPDDGDDREER
jgi:hypothetical protein